jgi:hypothetical protein
LTLANHLGMAYNPDMRILDYIPLESGEALKAPRPAIRGERLRAYGNLTNGKVSLKSWNYVIGHARRVLLGDVEFTVSAKVRQRVIERKKRLVHAFAVGNILYANSEFELLDFEEEIHYNPFRAAHFTRPDGSPIWRADSCLVVSDKKEDGRPYIYILTNPKIKLLDIEDETR